VGAEGNTAAIIAKLNAAVVSVLANPDVQRGYAAQGQEMWPRELQTPQALAAWHKAEVEKWSPIITAAHLKAE
jgi:tripartite-type tricarboxylate transporter receptor subunit TctC